MLEPVKRLTVSDQVFSQLKEKILLEEYQPGERLPSERELSERFAVNRSSIREALKRLEQSRLVRVRQGEGSVVLDFRQHGGFELLRDVVVAGGHINGVAVRSIFEFRSMIGPEIARLAALRIREPELAALGQIVDALEIEETTAKFQVLEFEFHHTMARASENLALLLILNSAKEIYAEHAEFFAGIFRSVSAEERGGYRRIVDALRNKESDKAYELTAALIEDGNRRFWSAFSAGESAFGAGAMG